VLVEALAINLVQVVVRRDDNGNLLAALAGVLAALRRPDSPVLLGVRLLRPRLVVGIRRLVLLPDGREGAPHGGAGSGHAGGDGALCAVEELLRARGAAQGGPARAGRVDGGLAGREASVVAAAGARLLGAKGGRLGVGVARGAVGGVVAVVGVVVVEVLECAGLLGLLVVLILALAPDPGGDADGRDRHGHGEGHPVVPYPATAGRLIRRRHWRRSDRSWRCCRRQVGGGVCGQVVVATMRWCC